MAIFGFGTVGACVAQLLDAQAFPGVEITHVFNRNVDRKRFSPAAQAVPRSAVWTSDPEEVLASPADVIIETIGGLDPTAAWISEAMRRGKSVVTANKQLIAYRGAELAELAARHGVHLCYNAAVAGGGACDPSDVAGVTGRSPHAAQRHPERHLQLYFEPHGATARRIRRCCCRHRPRDMPRRIRPRTWTASTPARSSAFLCVLRSMPRCNPDEIATQSIAQLSAIDFQYARELGCTIRQISRAQFEGDVVRARVAPMLVPLSSPIAWSHGTQNTVVTSGEFGGDVVFSGHGAGGRPTAVAIVSDLLTVVQRCASVRLPVTPGARVQRIPGAALPSAASSMTSPASCRPSPAHSRRWGPTSTRCCSAPGIPSTVCPSSSPSEPCLTSTVARAVSSIGELDCMLEPPLVLQMLTVDDKAED